MLEYFIPQETRQVVIYLKPISMRWGPTKLRSFCVEELGMEPDPYTAFLFFNRSQDSLLMYMDAASGEQTVIRKLDRGAFVVPVADADGAPLVTMKPAMIPKLFRA